MRYHSSLIKHYISIKDDVENIASKLILKTCEVEEIIQRSLPNDVVIGKVTSIRKHPQADKLVVCSVDCGEKGMFTICTGGENVTEGSYVPVALPGCYLPSIDLKIEPRKLRGEDSNGMICSKGELGINEDEEHHWIWTLQYDAKTDLTQVPQQPDFDDITDADCGVALKQKYPWLDAYIFDVDNKTVTHRPDLTGHFGIARELNAMYTPSAKTNISRSKLPTLMDAHTYTSIDQMVAHGNVHNIHIDVTTDAVQVYSTILLDGCTVQTSGFLPRIILRDCGNTPKNNWVDFSNLAMLMTGQPIHCFDADTVEGSIHVRYAKDGEQFTDLLDVTHILQTTDIVIADDKKILALGGIMGGKSSAVSDKTTRILIEVAHFDPVVVRKTGTKLSLRTDAELRFEKYINPQYTSHAVQMVLDLLAYWKKDLGTYTIQGMSYYTGQKYPDQPKYITVDWTKISQIIYGDDTLSADTAGSTLHGLGYGVDGNTVRVPWRRSPDDMNGQHDLIEEIIRIHGYETVEGKQLHGVLSIPQHEKSVHIVQTIEQCLADAQHYTQCESYPWIHEKYLGLFKKDTSKLYHLQNPPTPEQQYLRDSMIYGLLDIIIKNYKTHTEMSLFDIGKTRVYNNDAFHESRDLGILAYSEKVSTWTDDPGLGVKDAVVAALRAAGVKHPISFVPTQLPTFHTHKQTNICVGDIVLGHIGQIHPAIMGELKLPLESYLSFAYVALDMISDLPEYSGEKTYETAQDQIVTRDVCFVLDKSASYQTLWDAVSTIPEVKNVQPFDIYAGDKLPEGKKSCAFTCTIHGDGSMTSEQINAIMKRVITACEATGAVLR